MDGNKLKLVWVIAFGRVVGKGDTLHGDVLNDQPRWLAHYPPVSPQGAVITGSSSIVTMLSWGSSLYLRVDKHFLRPAYASRVWGLRCSWP